MQQVWKNKATPTQIHKVVSEYFASQYWKAVMDGYGKTLDEIDLNTPDHEMLKSIEQNIYQFSAAKDYAIGKAMSEALLDGEGKLRSYTDFRREALQIQNEFIDTWLKTEYNYAVAASRSASQWIEIQKDKDTLPLLQYQTVGDDRVRPAHRDLEGITLPVDDEFWNTYFPPNGWNCRCDVIQLADGKITDKSTISYPDKMDDLFKFNPGKQKIIFPEGHPYYDGMPNNMKTEALKLYKRNSKLKK